MVASRDGGTRRCEACARDVHDLTAASSAVAASHVLFRRERSICARIATVAVGVAAISCSSPRDPTTPTPDESHALDDDSRLADGVAQLDAGPGVDAAAGADSDMDGIPDAVDACPTIPGVEYNDPKKNGCPKVVIVESMGIVIIPQLLFARNRTDPPSASEPMIRNVVDVLKSRPEITKVEIEGYASKDEARPQALSEARAKAVYDLLVREGVEAKRLVIVGHGATRPVDPEDTAEGRARNRRVTFHIAETSDGACPFPNAASGQNTTDL
jgi:outer membrane protein OmpA-like peptidoglycan-associated protein